MAKKKKIKTEVVDIDQLYIQKKDMGSTILIAGVVGMIACLVVAALMMFGAFSLGGTVLWIHMVMIALMCLAGPYGFYASWKQKRIRDIEKRLPDFLRDVAEGGRFGMTLAQAIKVSSKGRYGSLTIEIQRMAAQIDWGVPASEALWLFTERVNTPLTKRMVSIIIKANDAGGGVSDVLTMVAHDARENIINQSERSLAMSTYTVVIYVAFGVFLATIFILNSTFLPSMETAGAEVAKGVEELGGTGGVALNIRSDIIAEVQVIFIMSVAIHAFGDGILAGVLQDGSIANGLRHSFIMLLIGLIGTLM
ncbi:MAG: type II secretion system F family protein [Euryarchaeota archaeon]|nr:type II secretion system F family protein [Euryarchaeota archaeon]